VLLIVVLVWGHNMRLMLFVLMIWIMIGIFSFKMVITNINKILLVVLIVGGLILILIVTLLLCLMEWFVS